MEDIKSIYQEENYKDIPMFSSQYSAPKKRDPKDNLDVFYGGEAYKYRPSGVREKMLDIRKAEKSLPTDRMHLGLERYLYSYKPIKTPVDAIELIARNIGSRTREVGMSIMLDENDFPLAINIDDYGEESRCQTYTKDFLRELFMVDAKKVIHVHCHPTIFSEIGTKEHFTPSHPDISHFQTMMGLLKVYGIELVDCVIVSERYVESLDMRIPAVYSIKNKTMMNLGGICEVSYSDEEIKRKKDTDISHDFDDEGNRIKHVNPVLTPEGLVYDDDVKTDIDI